MLTLKGPPAKDIFTIAIKTYSIMKGDRNVYKEVKSKNPSKTARVGEGRDRG